MACSTALRALIEARAPIDLIALATRFPLDEMVHVEICARMAMVAGGGTEIRHDPNDLFKDPPPGLTPLVRAADIVVRLLCVGEALSIPLLRGAWRAAQHPLPKAILRLIVRDEAAHGVRDAVGGLRRGGVVVAGRLVLLLLGVDKDAAEGLRGDLNDARRGAHRGKRRFRSSNSSRHRGGRAARQQQQQGAAGGGGGGAHVFFFGFACEDGLRRSSFFFLFERRRRRGVEFARPNDDALVLFSAFRFSFSFSAYCPFTCSFNADTRNGERRRCFLTPEPRNRKRAREREATGKANCSREKRRSRRATHPLTRRTGCALSLLLKHAPEKIPFRWCQSGTKKVPRRMRMEASFFFFVSSFSESAREEKSSEEKE